MTESKYVKQAREIGSVPGAGDILATPRKLDRTEHGRDAGSWEKAYDPPAASGIGPNPNQPFKEHDDPSRAAREYLTACGGSLSRARALFNDIADNPAVEFIRRVGSIEAATKALNEYECEGAEQQ
jgi:hypothetical protein